MKAQLAKVSRNLGSGLSRAATRVKATAIRVDKSELTEVIIATWCVEFLRTRRLVGLHVAGAIGISALTVAIKLIAIKASRRRSGDETFVMSDWHSPMGNETFHRNTPHPRRRVRNHRRRRPVSY